MFPISPQKTYAVGTHKKRLREALLMSTHNICFHKEISDISIYYDVHHLVDLVWDIFSNVEKGVDINSQ